MTQSFSEPAAAASGAVRLQMLIGGSWRAGATDTDIVDPYRGDVVARAPESLLGDLDDALSAAVVAKQVMAAMPGYERAALLRRAGVLLAERGEEIARVMVRETGKALKDARVEVTRSQNTI